MQSLKSINVLILINVATIFTISILGRGLQNFFFSVINKDQFYIVIAISFIFGFISLGVLLRSKITNSNSFFLRVSFCILIMLISQSYIVRPEEKLHLLLFSFLGFLISFFHKVRFGLTVGLLVSFGDEVLQYFVPNRFFGWDDVMINLYAAYVTFFILKYKSKQ